MSLEDRIKALEQWRDHINQALMYAPERKPLPQKAELEKTVDDGVPDEIKDLVKLENGRVYAVRYLVNDEFPRVHNLLQDRGYKYVPKERSPTGKPFWEKK